MGHMDEDRVYADRLGKTDLYVATGLGVAVVSVSNDRIGQFSIDYRCTARDIAADGQRLLVATDEDVLLSDGDGYAPTEFGPAVAVGPGPVAAAPDGTVAHLDDGVWDSLGSVDEPRAIDSDLLAAADGVYRLPDLDHVGLDDVVDVSGTATPLAATTDGLYRLGPGWTKDIDGGFDLVAGSDEQAHAGTGQTLYERVDGEWRDCGVPADEQVADVGYVADGGVVAVTVDGTCLVDPVAAKDGADGWRSRSLGLPEVAALAVPV